MSSTPTRPSRVKTLDASNFDRIVGSGSAPVLVDFWAEWCSPCRAIAPAIDRLATDMDGKAVVAKVDVDHNKELAARYEVQSIPTLIIFRYGKEVRRFVGVRTKDELESSLLALSC